MLNKKCGKLMRNRGENVWCGILCGMSAYGCCAYVHVWVKIETYMFRLLDSYFYFTRKTSLISHGYTMLALFFLAIVGNY